MWNTNRDLIRAWLILAGVFALFSLLQPFLIYTGLVHWANLMTAKALAFLLWVLGADGHADGTLVRSELFSLEIIAECTAILPIVIFTSIVLATPALARERLQALVLGWPAIVGFNLLRLLSLVYVGYLAPRAFETVHLLVWQPLLVIFSILLWLLWVERIRVRRTRRVS